MQLKRYCAGFTLTELAVVFAIVALLIGGAMMTLSAQVDVRNTEETQRRLEAAREAVLGFAIANRRLPCPAVSGATGVEALSSGTAADGGPCTTNYGGFLPAQTIGLLPVDAQGYGVDVWGNRIRYAVANLITGCTGTATTPHFTSKANLKANGVSCQPNDLDICTTATGSTATACASGAVRLVSSDTAAIVIFSTGKNGAITSAHGPDEAENIDGDRVFVSRVFGGPNTGGGAYDDQLLIVPVGVLYSRLIAAGVLP